MRDFFYFPEHCDLIGLLEAFGHGDLTKPRHLSKILYVIDQLYLKPILRKEDAAVNDGFVPLNFEVLTEILSTRYAARIKQVLVQVGIIEEKRSKKHGGSTYQVGKISKCFRLTARYRQQTFRRRQLQHKSFLRKVERERLKQNDNSTRGHVGKMLIRKSIESITFDCAGARRFVEQSTVLKPTQKMHYEVIISLFEAKEFGFTTKTGRFHHIFTYCPRDLRQFACWKEKPLFQIDVSNCQPALHAILYPTNSEEKEKFVDIVSKGNFFQYLNQKLDKPHDLTNPAIKNSFKEEVFHKIFYGAPWNQGKSALGATFRKEFSELDEQIRIAKKGTTNELPIRMQKLEGSIVINNVALGVAWVNQKEDMCLISIHDALLTTSDYVESVQQAMKDAFVGVLGFNVAVKVTRLTAPGLEEHSSDSLLAQVAFSSVSTTSVSGDTTSVFGNEAIIEPNASGVLCAGSP